MECKYNNLYVVNQSKCLDFRVNFFMCYCEYCLIYLVYDLEEFGWLGLCGKFVVFIGYELVEFVQWLSVCRFLRQMLCV